SSDLILILLFFSFGTYAQKEYGHELGVNLFSLTNYGDSQIDKESSMDINPPSGIMFKRQCGKNAVRMSLDYYHSTYEGTYNGPYYEERSRGKFNQGILRIGYERKLSSTALQPYFATDIALSYSRDQGILERNRSAIVEMPYGSFDYNYKSISYGIAPAVGLRYNFSERFSVSIESNINIMLFKELYFADNWTSSTHIGENLEITFNPLRLFSINYSL